jgi:hypothetical protein
MFASASSFNKPLDKWNVLRIARPGELAHMFFGADAMKERNKPSVEKFNKYLELVLIESGKTATAAISGKKIPIGRTPDGTVLTKETPDEITDKIIGYAYTPEIARKVLQPGLNRARNYAELERVRHANEVAVPAPEPEEVVAVPAPATEEVVAVPAPATEEVVAPVPTPEPPVPEPSANRRRGVKRPAEVPVPYPPEPRVLRSANRTRGVKRPASDALGGRTRRRRDSKRMTTKSKKVKKTIHKKTR